jgi:glycine cleavage system H protein
MDAKPETISYKQSRFQTRLPVGRLYTPSHFWLAEQEPGVWRVGFTRFATRMLGDLVEHGFEVKPGDAVAVGQTVGWVEGFKAMTDLYCVADGAFAGGNPDLATDMTVIDKDPYHKGWLYLVRGTPDANSLPVEGYVGVLDATIDKMKAQYE